MKNLNQNEPKVQDFQFLHLSILEYLILEYYNDLEEANRLADTYALKRIS